MQEPETKPPQARAQDGRGAGLWTAKKRVFAEVLLADQLLLKGWLYADLLRIDGTPATIADRLNDPREKYVPIATEKKHFLLNKSRVVLIRLTPSEIQVPSSEGLRVLNVIVRLTTGLVEKGELRAVLPPARSRLLDYLNIASEPFLTLFGPDRIVLINSDAIAGVTEVPGPV